MEIPWDSIFWLCRLTVAKRDLAVQLLNEQSNFARSDKSGLLPPSANAFLKCSHFALSNVIKSQIIADPSISQHPGLLIRITRISAISNVFAACDELAAW